MSLAPFGTVHEELEDEISKLVWIVQILADDFCTLFLTFFGRKPLKSNGFL
jgi:hypothetical protein